MSRYGCFTAGTQVLMADGTTKAIEEVTAGEKVISHDPVTGHNVEGTVEQVHVHEDVPTLKLTTTAGEITTTATHPFYVEDKGWLPAGELREGDHLRPADGSTSTVEVLTLQATGHTQTVHNLTITGWKNYHVLTKDNPESVPVLVHNDGPCDDPVAAVQEAARDAASRGRQDLLGTLTEAQQDAVTAKPGLSTPFTGHAVHNQTKVALADKYGEGVFEYNPSHGPDFTYLPTGEKIELTTPKQVDAHKARPNPEYQDCGYATYDLPDWGT